jgi:hypothetical protein
MFISYPFQALISVLVFGLVHLLAEKTKKLDRITHGKFLSMGGGVAIAYVFIDLLPKLCKSDALVTTALQGAFPYFARHVYIMALAGFLLFFGVAQTSNRPKSKHRFWLSLSSYALFNFFVGYAVVDQDNIEVRPLLLFTIAMALHYFTNDYTLSQEHGKIYRKQGRWILALALLLGWLTGAWVTLSEPAIALISAFIGGGVIMNVTRHELPSDRPNSLQSFFFFTLLYTALLLFVGV